MTTEPSRDALIAAAKKLFALHGFDATSVKQLANEANVNVSLISYYFGGKEGLYQACLEDFAQNNLPTMERILVPPSSVEEFRVRVRMFLDELICCCQSESDVAKIIDRDIHLGNPITERIFQGTFMKLYETSVEFLRKAQANGVLRTDFDPMLAAGLLFGSVTHLNRMQSISEKIHGFSIADPEYREKAMDHIQLIFSDSLIARNGNTR